MHTDSSASLTYLASVSASEWTTTVRMPSSRQALWMRSAISPRLAIRILPNINETLVGLPDQEERLAVSDALPVRGQDLLHRPGHFSLDLVEQFHRLDDAQCVARLDRLSHLH